MTDADTVYACVRVMASCRCAWLRHICHCPTTLHWKAFLLASFYQYVISGQVSVLDSSFLSLAP